jgi:hypothetical protein
MRRQAALACGSKPKSYPPYIFHTLHVNAGVFPQDSGAYDRFGELFLSAITDCDMLIAWDVAGEAEILARYARKATLVNALEPFFSPTPWTQALAGKRVLVISPFTESIRKQYAVRGSIWDDPRILPEFTLRTLRAPLSAALTPPADKDWFAALARMQEEMDEVDYQVALIADSFRCIR